MELGMIGLGRMGGNMAERLVKGGHRVVAYDRDPDALRSAQQRGLDTAASLEELAAKLKAPRAVWVIDAGVSSEVSAANEVLRFVRRGAYVSAVSFMTGDVEAVEIELQAEAPVVGVAIGDLDRPDGMVIGGVLRDGEAIVPRGATVFAEGDRVIVFATPDSTAAVEKLFTV